MKINLAKEFYFQELEGKAHQDERLATHLLMLSLVGGIVVFLIRDLPHATSRIQTIASLLAAASYSCALYYVLRATVGHKYEALPAADHLLKYHMDLKAYYEAEHADKEASDREFDAYLLRHLASAAAGSRATNLRRSAHYYRSSEFTAGAITLATVAGLAMVWPFAKSLFH